jgi:hypothetical protein
MMNLLPFQLTSQKTSHDAKGKSIKVSVVDYMDESDASIATSILVADFLVNSLHSA